MSSDQLPVAHTDFLIIGAGQSGLAAAYYLQQQRVPFIILEAASTVGHVWDARYDSLRLFSPAWASGLPGRPWPKPRLRYPTRRETADYLRDYAAHFRFPVQLNQRVAYLGVRQNGVGYYARTTAGQAYTAQRVIIATGAYTTPAVPAFAAELATTVAQFHSSSYQRPAQLPGCGPVAVVGSGNSALQIAADIAPTGRKVFVAFDEKTPAMPNHQLMWGFLALTRLMRISRFTSWLGNYLYTQPEPVVSADLARLRRQPTVHFIGRAKAAGAGGSLRGQRASTPPLAAVVWATGFRPSYGWLDLPILDAAGTPSHYRGLTAAPGVAFLGLDWLDSRSSALLYGAGADARRVVASLLATPTRLA